MKNERTWQSSELNQFTFREIDKIGSIISLIAQKTNGIFLTRLIKYLYSIDETSVKEIGVPVLPFEYRVAEKGPLILELRDVLPRNTDFKKYISVNYDDKYKGNIILSVGDPNLLRFSDYELELVDRIIKEYATVSTDEIIDHLHTHDGSLWKAIVEKEKIDFKKSKISEHSINFRNHVKGNETSSFMFDTYFATRKS